VSSLTQAIKFFLTDVDFPLLVGIGMVIDTGAIAVVSKLFLTTTSNITTLSLSAVPTETWVLFSIGVVLMLLNLILGRAVSRHFAQN
jgi:uncharacterized membrane protein (DUF373 family)